MKRVALGLLLAVVTAMLTAIVWYLRQDTSVSSVADDSTPVMTPSAAVPLRVNPEMSLPVPGASLQPEFLTLQVGDQFSWWIPDEQRLHRGLVTEVRDTAAGNRMLQGWITDAGVDHRFLVTAGRLQTFGTVYTAAGGYQMEMRGGVTRFVSMRSLKDTQLPDDRDYVIPVRPKEPSRKP